MTHAVRESRRLLSRQRRGDPRHPPVAVEQIESQLGLAVSRTMAEAGLYAPKLAALALKQAQGDAAEAAFLLRAFRATLLRLGVSLPLDLNGMAAERHLATTQRAPAGGQMLGASYDHTHRLLEFDLLADTGSMPADEPRPESPMAVRENNSPAAGLVEPSTAGVDAPPFDLTAGPPTLPAGRDQRLQGLARGDEGFLAGLAYSTMRGFGRSHPFLERLRIGRVPLRVLVPELDDTAVIAEIEVTEAVTIHKHLGNGADDPPRFVRGYGLAFGRNERRAIAMAILDHAMRVEELGGEVKFPAQAAEFVLAHADSLDASGMVQHLKLPHHVDFQAELMLVRALRDGS